MKKSEKGLPKKGMNRQTHPSELTPQEYSFALNANIQEEHGDGDLILVNEPSNIKCSGFKEGFSVVKHKFDRVRNKTYFFLANEATGCSEIGWIDMTYAFEGNEPLEKACKCDVKVILEDGLENTLQESTCEYNTLISDYCELTGSCTGCLGFSLDRSINDVVIRHSQRGDELYFTDGDKPQKHINVDKVYSYFQDVDDCTGEITETCLDCDKLRIFNTYDFPCMKVEKIQNGGGLIAGLYEVTIAYSDVNGNEVSDYLSLTNPVSIFDENNTVLDQTSLDYKTNQAFSVDISDLDLDYDYYRVVIATRTGNNPGIKYTTYGVFPTSQNKIVISSLPTIRGEMKEVTEYDILNRRPLYLTSEGLSEVGGFLFQHTLTNQKEINLQPVVSLMGGFVKWGTVEALEKLYKDGANSSLYKSHMRDEVEPLSIQFKKRGGYRTANFPFIPRPPRNEEISLISEDDDNYQSILETVPDCAEVGRDKVWQFTNTATIESSSCLEGNVEGEVIVDETYSCESETKITIGSGSFPFTFTESIAEYIQNNRGEILTTTDSELEDIRNAIDDLSDYADCEPEVGENCTTPVFVEEKILVETVVGESEEEVDTAPEDYSEVLPPATCESLQEPVTGNSGVEGALPASLSVNQKTIPSNTTCITASEIQILTPGSPNSPFHLDDAYQIGNNSNLLTTIDVSTTSTVFKNKLHSNAVYFKVSSFATEKITIQLSEALCTVSDDNTSNSVRVSVFEGCPTLVEKPLYGSIISDITAPTVGDKIITLTTSDFPSGVAYIVIDSPMRTDYKVNLPITGTSGEASITIEGTVYTATFNTDVATTTSDFYSTNSASWSSAGYFPDFSGGVISLRLLESVNNTVFTTNVSGDLLISPLIIEEYHTLQPPCGCFSIYRRETTTNDSKTYDSITFTKQQIYSYTCAYTQPIVTECDPAPHRQGKFSHWESTYKYPCNKELYDSSWLDIDESDIPQSIKDDFEEYYVASTSGTTYNLNSSTNFMDKPIRHYKFPDNRVVPFMKTQDASQGAKPESLIYPIGFVISNEVINAFLDIAVKNNLLTLEERSDIVGYEIFRGDRSTERSIIAKGLAFNTKTYRDEARADTPLTYYPNYPLNDLSVDDLNGISSSPEEVQNVLYTFHSPDTHFNKPTLPFELGFDGYQTGNALNSFTPLRDHPKYVILGRRAKRLATGLAILEATAETLITVSELLVSGASGGVSAPVSAPIGIAAGVAIIAATVFKVGRYRYEWLSILEQLGNGYNHAYTALSVGNYHDFRVNTQSGSTLRGLKINTYLNSGYKEVREEGLAGKSYFINNFQRETSTLIKMSDNFPLVYDSGVLGYDNTRANIQSINPGTSSFNARTLAPYVTLKQYLPNQYNTLNSIQWLHTGYCGNLLEDNSCDIIFGGDTFISRMTLKRKFPFFTETAWKLSFSTPFKYSSYFNINTGSDNNRGFIDYKTTEDSFNVASLVFPEIPTRYSLWSGASWVTSVNNSFYVNDRYKFLTYYYGIPSFLVESEINLNYRYARLEKHEDFYPNVGDVLNWTQQSEVPITFDNEYNYNFVYSSRPHPWASGLLPLNYNKEEWDKLDDKENAVIYSREDDISSSIRSPFLNYRVNDFHNFNKSFGKIIDIKGIESDQVWVRFTDGMVILGAVDTLKDRLTQANENIGIGGIFNERTVNFNKTELGSAGTQHKASVSNEFGHYWVDAKRGKVHHLKPNAQGISEISQSMDKWFKEQLPFKILKVYPNVDVDNAYGGIGISMGWDDRLKRVFVTKLDYIPKSGSLNYIEGSGFYTGDVITPCPEGYELLDGVCTRTTTVDKVPMGAELLVQDSKSTAYGDSYVSLYSTYNPDGTADIDGGSPTGFTYQKLEDPFWKGSPSGLTSIVNMLGKWGNSFSLNTWYGVTSIIDVPDTKTYYVFLAGDNRFRFSINGTVVVTSDYTTMKDQHGISVGLQDTTTFKIAHIYPIVLEAGCQRIKVEGLNEGEGSPGMFAAGILDNTSAEIVNATSKSDLNFIYSTEMEETFYETITDYTCPEGFIPTGEDFCDTCVKTERIPPSQKIELDNEEYFEKAFWTVGYSPLTENWISYYSFYPNYYNSYNEYFQTGINELGSNRHGVWTHHPFISSYQVFYGELFPFIVEIASRTNAIGSYMESVQFYLDVRKYSNMYDFSDTFGKGFNKAYIYNNFQNSGLLKLNFQEGENQRQLIDFPKYNSDSIEVLQSKIEGKWSFNFLYNSIKNERQGLPIWLNDNVQVLKDINPKTIDYRAIRRDRIRGDYFITRLIQDEDSRNRMFFRMTDITRNYNE